MFKPLFKKYRSWKRWEFKMEDNLQAQVRVLEPLYRMMKVIEQRDDRDAKIAGALATQYIAEHYQGKMMGYGDMQQVLRAVLIYFADGKYYSSYLENELQVKVVGWLTISMADMDYTIAKIGQLADDLARWLSGKNALDLKAEAVWEHLLQLTSFDAELQRRLNLNEKFYKQELIDILGK